VSPAGAALVALILTFGAAPALFPWLAPLRP
jgi:hypothetical protein